LHDLNLVSYLGGTPYATLNTIYFPISWIEAIEKDDLHGKRLAEWSVVHTVSRIHNNDILRRFGIKVAISAGGMIAFGGVCLSVLEFYARCQPDQVDIFNFQISRSTITGTAIVAAATVALWYEYLYAESRADVYAIEHCNDPELFLAAYEHVDRFAPRGFIPGMQSSFAEFRLARIRDGFKAKFGYELKITPQSIS